MLDPPIGTPAPMPGMTWPVPAPVPMPVLARPTFPWPSWWHHASSRTAVKKKALDEPHKEMRIDDMFVVDRASLFTMAFHKYLERELLDYVRNGRPFLLNLRQIARNTGRKFFEVHTCVMLSVIERVAATALPSMMRERLEHIIDVLVDSMITAPDPVGKAQFQKVAEQLDSISPGLNWIHTRYKAMFTIGKRSRVESVKSISIVLNGVIVAPPPTLLSVGADATVWHAVALEGAVGRIARDTSSSTETLVAELTAVLTSLHNIRNSARPRLSTGTIYNVVEHITASSSSTSKDSHTEALRRMVRAVDQIPHPWQAKATSLAIAVRLDLISAEHYGLLSITIASQCLHSKEPRVRIKAALIVADWCSMGLTRTACDMLLQTSKYGACDMLLQALNVLLIGKPGGAGIIGIEDVNDAETLQRAGYILRRLPRSGRLWSVFELVATREDANEAQLSVLSTLIGEHVDVSHIQRLIADIADLERKALTTDHLRLASRALPCIKWASEREALYAQFNELLWDIGSEKVAMEVSAMAIYLRKEDHYKASGFGRSSTAI